MGLLLASAAGAKEMKAPPKPQNVLTPAASLERLKGETRVMSRAYRCATISNMSAKRWPEARTPTLPC
jgi:hypothetical protein